MAKQSDLDSKLIKQLSKIVEKGTAPYRKEISQPLHMCDVSYDALLISSPDLTLDSYNFLVEKIKNGITSVGGDFVEYNDISFIEEAISMLFAASKGLGRSLGKAYALIWADNYKYILSTNYRNLQNAVATGVKAAEQDPRFSGKGLSEFAGIKFQRKGVEVSRSGAEIAHIEGPGSVTALGAQLASILEKTKGSSNFTLFTQKVQNLQKRLQDAHQSVVEVTTKRNDIFSKNPEILNQVLLVTIQSGFYNGKLSEIEKQIGSELKQVLSSQKYLIQLLNKPGSNTILEDISELLGVTLGKKRTAGSKHPNRPPSKVILKPRYSSTTASTVRVPKLRTKAGQFFSLASLQRLLDASLVQRVKDNMGTGSRRDILNLRSGRFAESVKVERLSQSREGMITAFYNYMKNPYATFSQGGRQELPRSRDPKLLIAKSIREIGATMVANRMRAVLV